MDELYYEDGQVPDLASSGFTFSDEVIAKALVGIYKGEVDIDKGVEQNLYRETLRIINKATAKGISDAIDSGAPAPKKDFLWQLRHSNEVFSAFKTHTQQNHLADLLTDSKGKLKPFGQFAKDSEAVIGKYNRQWLRTEYDTAVIRAHQAANWQKFKEEKDVLPNLEWIPSTSPNPSEDHMVFWGTILPVDDGFWDAHRPGDRWNCKCDLRSTDKAATHAPDADIISKHDEPAKGLDNNPGKDGKIFNQSHPYFPKSCAACPFSSNGKPSPLADNIIGDCCKCGNITTDPQTSVTNQREYKVIVDDIKGKYHTQEEKYEAFKKLIKNETYIRTEYPNGGFVEKPVHLRQNKDEEPKNIDSAEFLAKEKGERIRLLPTNPFAPKSVPQLDAYSYTDNIIFEIKNPDSSIGSNAVQNSVKKANNQRAAVVFIRMSKEYTVEDISLGLKNSFMNDSNKNVKKIRIRLFDGSYKTYDADILREQYREE